MCVCVCVCVAISLSLCVLFSASVNVQPDGMESLITLSEGDMRRALNILQVNNILPFSPLYTCSGLSIMCVYSLHTRLLSLFLYS